MLYKGGFYTNRESLTAYSSKVILNLIISLLNPNKITSAIDIGCGTGVWLKYLEKIGSSTVGVEGEWLPNHLYLPNGKLLKEKIDKKLPILSDRFDLCISLEVAEHLPLPRSHSFIKDLASYSDIILFSAAPPGQGGKGHFNEQPLSFWNKIFIDNGYKLIDCIRPIIWNDTQIPVWYRQNCVLFVKSSKINSLIKQYDSTVLLDAIHPELFYDYRYPRLFISLLQLINLPRALIRSIKRRLHRKL